ncbi:prickle-like protein 4 isoform X2 [Cebus imitator]|uniref:prickle-like protein 4 isoform X2 n=1 Tax=Cebus imitator TaxID=2715852 RepID=UPI0018998583|nr:prickle-like protein 4 isoform X2 [Cebus imitator]
MGGGRELWKESSARWRWSLVAFGEMERGSAVRRSGYSWCEQPILAAFHGKSDLRDRRGRKQGPAVLGLGSLCLDTNQAPSWTGLQTLLQQLPPQDIDEPYCLALGEEELAELRLFCARRKQEALGQGVARLLLPKLKGHTCEKCRELLKPGEYGVFAARAGEQRCWHQPCFACQACGQALVNLIYFYHDGQLYCGRHHAELLRPRCPACDQLIFSRHCTEAEGRHWHENHFCCQDCAGPLGGGRYALPGGSPCCPSCFENRYSDAGWSSAGALEGQAFLGTGETGPDRTEGRDQTSLNSVTLSRTLLAAAGCSSLQTRTGLPGSSPQQESRPGDKAEAPKRQEQCRLKTPRHPKDTPFPTYSSSSDSEPEGFFLGERLPLSWKTPGSLQAEDSNASKKHCTVC